MNVFCQMFPYIHFRTGEYPPKEFFGFSDTESLINFWK